jgi:cytochrome c553
MRPVVLAALSLCIGVPSALAAEPRLVALGREIAEGAVLEKEFACSRCHGVLGRGNPEEGAAPRIAAQPAFYLEKQLDDFAEGTRPSAKMAPVARALSDEQRSAVAAYYGSLWWVPYPEETPYAEPMLIQQGGVLSAIGDAERGIGACEICHADAGVGIAPSFPYLAGQYADYTEKQLSMWKAGERRNDPLDVMAEIARRLEEDEIRALALYFARVRPPSAALSSPIPEEPIPPPPAAPSVPD